MVREIIYRNRNNIEEFGVDENDSVNKVLFDTIFQIQYVSIRNDLNDTLLGLFNDAYYICTLILLEKRPYFNINKYIKILSGCQYVDSDRIIIVMSMVSVYLKTLDMITEDIDKTINVIKSKFSGLDDELFEKINSVTDGRTLSIKASNFYPVQFPDNEEHSMFWETYHKIPSDIAKLIDARIEKLKKEESATNKDIDKIFDDKKQIRQTTVMEKDMSLIVEQKARGIKILRNLNDVEEVDYDKKGLPVVKIYEGQKSYDERELEKLEAKVYNWQNETITFLITMGFNRSNIEKHFQTEQSITSFLDKRKNLAEALQKGLIFLRDIDKEYRTEKEYDEIAKLRKECEKWKLKYKEALDKEPEKAFNRQTGLSCFTSRQMGILLTAVGRLTEKDDPPGKTTIGEIVEKISGYKTTTANANMKGTIPEDDTKTVAEAIESKFPNLAAEVRKI